MPNTQVPCPNCRQPAMADIEQLFDLFTNPQAKQIFLSGNFNIIQCQICGFTGQYPIPLIYHDPDHELLLTYFPPDLNTPVNDQERQIGSLITKISNSLPQEKRKGYLFNPQRMLTLQTMVEKIMAADGITKEMLDNQQKRVKLIEKLIKIPSENREGVIKEEEANIDEELFIILNQITQLTLQQGDQQGAQEIAQLQKDLFEHTAIGNQLKELAEETEKVYKDLQTASKEGLSREKLLAMLIESQTETRVEALVKIARSGMDYEFFQLLTSMIDAETGEEKSRLESLREKVLTITEEIDKALALESKKAGDILEKILAEENTQEALMKYAQSINEFFLEQVQIETQKASESQDKTRLDKLNIIIQVIQQSNAPMEEINFIESLLQVEDEGKIIEVLDQNQEKITPEFLQLLNGIISQSEEKQQPPELIEKLRRLSSIILKFSMNKNLSNQ
ncbi:MAG: hypothetical protein JEZ06_17230 [Anaerolineaceae bacterium]|nr:hypothetical protein [Anaerolineaceae bacterium]